MKIPIHSTTDLITNSSTTIFTYSESSEQAVVEMINELFASFGIDKTCGDVFYTVVLADKYDYEDRAIENEFAPEGMTSEEAGKLYDQVKNGEIEKPEWFNDVEEKENNWSYYTPSTYLHLIPKKEEYAKLANLIKKFLYSTNHEATYDG